MKSTQKSSSSCHKAPILDHNHRGHFLKDVPHRLRLEVFLLLLTLSRACSVAILGALVPIHQAPPVYV